MHLSSAQNVVYALWEEVPKLVYYRLICKPVNMVLPISVAILDVRVRLNKCNFVITVRPVKINSLFLILRARSFSYDSDKNKGKKQRFIFHFSITIIVKYTNFCFFTCVNCFITSKKHVLVLCSVCTL